MSCRNQILLVLALLVQILAQDLLSVSSLLEDDECTSRSDDCAMNALQLRAKRSNSSKPAPPKLKSRARDDPSTEEGEGEGEVEGNVTEPSTGTQDEDWDAVQTCNATTSCATGFKCVPKADGTWSQCVDCTKENFERDCVKWDDGLRYAAVRTCSMTCPDSRCYNQTWCPSGGYKCAIDTRLVAWGQCVLCNPYYFLYKCGSWNPKYRKVAGTYCQKYGTSRGAKCK